MHIVCIARFWNHHNEKKFWPSLGKVTNTVHRQDVYGNTLSTLHKFSRPPDFYDVAWIIRIMYRQYKSHSCQVTYLI